MEKKRPSRGPGFICVFCDRYFNPTCDQRIHIRRHIQEKPYDCEFCDYTATCKADINTHCRNVHSTRIPQVQCTLCPAVFRTVHYLKCHFRRMHGNETTKLVEIVPQNDSKPLIENPVTVEDPAQSSAPPEASYRHECDLCGKVFNLKSTLITHRRTHTGERPYICPTCGKGFNQKGNYNHHVRRHQGLKPFQCSVCSKRFNRKQHCQGHIQKCHETGDVVGPRPYQRGVHLLEKNKEDPKKSTSSQGKGLQIIKVPKKRKVARKQRLQCMICLEKFPSIELLQEHFYKGHEEPVIVTYEPQPVVKQEEDPLAMTIEIVEEDTLATRKVKLEEDLLTSETIVKMEEDPVTTNADPLEEAVLGI